MPMYDVRCFSCGETGTIFRKIDERDNVPHCFSCGKLFTRVISPTRILTEIAPYESPKTGKWITSRSEQREDLRLSGSILSEPGLEKDIARNKEYAREKAFEPVSRAIDATTAAMVAAGKLET